MSRGVVSNGRAMYLSVLVAVVGASGCGPSSSGGEAFPAGGAAVSAGASSSNASTASSTQPLVAIVEPDRTLQAAPGDGVGVFTEYQSGGHWHVWWTCDTNATALSCSFQILASVTSGAITNAVSDGFQPPDVLSASAQQIAATTITSTGVDGIDFDTSPGQSLELDASINGQHSGQFLFFVQDGVVNGGYRGSLTDPIIFEPGSS